jgi:hypothetical protein
VNRDDQNHLTNIKISYQQPGEMKSQQQRVEASRESATTGNSAVIRPIRKNATNGVKEAAMDDDDESARSQNAGDATHIANRNLM